MKTDENDLYRNPKTGTIKTLRQWGITEEVASLSNLVKVDSKYEYLYKKKGE